MLDVFIPGYGTSPAFCYSNRIIPVFVGYGSDGINVTYNKPAAFFEDPEDLVPY